MKKIIFIVVLAISAVIISSACKNPPIFAAIEQEVKLKPASIKGFVRGVIRIGNKFYTSNGKLFYKTVGKTTEWSGMKGCPDGFCTGLASDGTNLYAAFAKNEAFTVHKYDTATSKWKQLDGLTAQTVVGTENVFAINSVKSGSTTTYSVFAIEHGVPSTTPWRNTKFPSGAARTYCMLEDGLYSKTGTKIAGSGSPTSGLKGICEGPAASVFAFTDTTLYCYDGSTWTNIKHGVNDPQSITYLSGRQLVLISGKRGYGEIKLAGSNTNLTGAQSVKTGSAHSSVPSGNIHQYTNSVGKYTINPINAFDYGSGDYIIYVGVKDPNTKYTGLWGFYSFDKKEWNRE